LGLGEPLPPDATLYAHGDGKQATARVR